MFDFQKSFRFAATVKVQTPSEDGPVEKTFTGLFQFVDREELRKLYAETPGVEDETMIRKTLIGWKEDLTQVGVPLPYSDEAREDLIAVPFVRYAIAQAYWAEISGVREKN